MHDNQLATLDKKPNEIQQVALNNMIQAHNLTQKFYKKFMVKDQDYGVIKGTSSPSLYQAGAEKLARLFKFSVEKELVKEVINFDKGFFYYKYKTTVKRSDGTVVTQMERSCNSFENKYRFTWVSEKFASELQKKQAVQRFKKRASNGQEYWNIKVPKKPEELAEDINTFEAMAQKRSFVAAIREACMAATIFTDKEIELEEVESESRKKLNARYFIAAQERGFSAEGAKASLKRKHEVDSFNDLTDQEIEDGITFLESSYEKVGKENKPKKITNTKPVEKENLINKKQTKTNISQEVPEKGEIIENEEEKIKCQGCHVKIDKKKAFLKKFCNPKCQQKYWKETKK